MARPRAASPQLSGIVPGYVGVGLALGLTISPASTDALNIAATGERSEASGITQMTRQVGRSIGLAVLGAIIAGRESPAAHTAHAARTALTKGTADAYSVAAALMTAVALAAFVFVRHTTASDAEPAIARRGDRDGKATRGGRVNADDAGRARRGRPRAGHGVLRAALRPDPLHRCRLRGARWDRVTIVIDATETGGAFDVVEVLVQPGRAAPPHCHAFAEWFHILDGALQFLTVSCGALKPTAIVEQGGTYVVPPWAPHALQNTTATPVRFLLAGQPGVMSSYFVKAGVRIRDAQSRPSVPPPSPSALAELAARHGIHLLDGSRAPIAVSGAFEVQ